MKYLLLMSMLVLSACTSDKTESDRMTRKIRELDLELASCHNQLANNSSNSFNNPPQAEEPSAPAEPECNDVEYNELYVDGKLFATCVAEDVKLDACGAQAGNCENGFSYVCLQNVKYKTITKKKCN